MRKRLKKNFCATAIGSVPHTDARKICEKILTDYSDAPFWPQLPKRAFFENMYAQYMERFPCAVIDEARKKVWIDSAKDMTGEIEKAYEKIIEGDADYFAITPKHAAGFYEFLSLTRSSDLSGVSYLKGHVTGPISFGLSVTDEKKQSILYHPELSFVLTKVLAMKARYQIRKLREVFPDVIIFIDEPYLVSIGSSVVNIKKEDVTTKISEVIGAIHEEGALAGIHCCGNTDWSLLLGLDIDILNFDAYGYPQSMSLYPDSVKGFIKRGGVLAWGIVPTSDEARQETVETLLKKLDKGISYLSDKGVDKKDVLGSLMVTPSCGLGTMSADEAIFILDMNKRLSERLCAVYGR